MSGTSLDGLDLVAVQFRSHGRARLSFAIQAAETRSYSEEWKGRLQNAYRASGRELIETHWHYGSWLGEQVKDFVDQAGIQDVIAVGSHGHTVFHQPEAGYTYQIGEGHALHEACGLPVVADFRSGNVAKGGQGAPLVPIGDALLFGDYAACINLGGFANISHLDVGGNRIAYDVVPCNYVLNRLAQRMGFAYDEGGEIAKTGKHLDSWLKRLNAEPFFQQLPPKSLGQEWVEQHVAEFLASQQLPQDLMATYVRHVAYQLYSALKGLAHQGNGKALVTGGGAYHQFLIDLVQEMLPQGISLEVPSAQVVEYKEALIFALLAQRWVLGLTNCIGSATGVTKDNIVGVGFGVKTQ